jgi:hypothetical protein
MPSIEMLQAAATADADPVAKLTELVDDRRDRLDVARDEYPRAFVAWLAPNYDRDGRYERVDED